MQQFAAVSSMDKPEENLAEVINQLSGGQDPSRVLCCGHSLGGALATLGEPCHVGHKAHSHWQLHHASWDSLPRVLLKPGAVG